MSVFAKRMLEGMMENEKDKNDVEQVFGSVEENGDYFSNLLNQCKSHFKATKIRVPKISDHHFSIDEETLISDMQETTILASHLTDDIYNITLTVENIRNIKGNYEGVLTHLITKKGPYRIKNAQELEAYMNTDQKYNEVKLLLKRAEAKLEQYKNHKRCIDQKLFFLGGMLTKRNRDREEEDERD